MKSIARIYKWIIISVALQLIMLSYFNFIYLPGRSNIKATFFEDGSKTDISVVLPNNASDIKVSFDGAFAGYIDGGNLEIIELRKGKKIKTIAPDTEELSYYRWLPDRNMVIYALCDSKGSSAEVNINTFELDLEMERSYPPIKKLPAGSRVHDLELSPLTNIVYVKVNTSETKSRIYKFNIMDNLSFIDTMASDVEIKALNYSDSLTYAEGSKLRIRNGISGALSTFSFESKIVLLAIDSKDNIYAGELNEEGKVVRIRFGKTEDFKDKNWEVVELERPLFSREISVTPDGSIYATSEANRIYDLRSDRQIAYSGEFLGMLNEAVISKNGNRLNIKNFD